MTLSIAGHTFLPTYLRATSVVVDLGANSGEFSLGVANRFGCQVHALEPVPQLSSRIPHAERGAVQIHSMAVHSTSGWFDFCISGNPYASSFPSVGHVPTAREVIQVRAITLEEFFLSQRIESIDLLKMDIEGAELDVLDVISDSTLLRIKQMAVEFHQFRFPSTALRVATVKRRLRNLGFWDIDFSRINGDVLFVNSALSLGLADRSRIVWDKYRRGLVRRVRRLGALS